MFASSAKCIVRESLKQSQDGSYLFSWKTSIKARWYYLADAVARITTVVFDALLFLYQTFRLLYTWGNEQNRWSEVAQKADKSLSCFLSSLFGAFVSPTLAYIYQEARFSDVVTSVVFRIFPDKLYYTLPGTSFKPAWVFTLRDKGVSTK